MAGRTRASLEAVAADMGDVQATQAALAQAVEQWVRLRDEQEEA